MDKYNSDRRSDIVKAALKVFSKNGYHKGRMEDIAREAGIGKATLYDYYSSKDVLFYQMLKYYIDDYFKNAYEVIDNGKGIRDTLTNFIDYNLNHIFWRSDAIEQLFYNSKSISTFIKPLITQTQKSFYHLIYKIIEAGIASYELRDTIDKDVATLIIIGAINNISMNRVIYETDLNITLDSSTVVNMLLLGLGNKQII